MGVMPCASIPLQPAVAGMVALGSQKWESYLYPLSSCSTQESGPCNLLGLLGGDGLDGKDMSLPALMI